jgi:hypothetical protein
MTSSPWLIEEIVPPSEADLAKIERARGPVAPVGVTRGKNAPVLAITLHDVVIHDVRKWFGGADIRIDALVVRGRKQKDEEPIYQPRTFRFPGVRDGEKLGIDTGGLLIYHGKTVDFLDISIMVSRDRQDSDTLDSLITGAARSDAVTQAAQAIGALALSAGAAALVGPALAGAGALADLVYRLIKNICGDSLGLYHGSWLQVRDGFGVGPHPEDRSSFAIKDIAFRYEIAVEDSKNAKKQR